MSARGIFASYLLSLLSKITNHEHTSQYELVRDPDSKTVNCFLINKRKQLTPYDNMLTLILLNIYLDLNFNDLHADSDKRFADGNDIGLVSLGPIALFSGYNLTTSSGKHLEDRSHATTFSLMYEIFTSARGCDDLSIGFDHYRVRREREVTNNRKHRGKNHVRFMLRDIFDFAEHKKKLHTV